MYCLFYSHDKRGSKATDQPFIDKPGPRRGGSNPLLSGSNLQSSSPLPLTLHTLHTPSNEGLVFELIMKVTFQLRILPSKCNQRSGGRESPFLVLELDCHDYVETYTTCYIIYKLIGFKTCLPKYYFYFKCNLRGKKLKYKKE